MFRFRLRHGDRYQVAASACDMQGEKTMNRSSHLLSAQASRRRFLQVSSLSVMGITLAACVAPAPAGGMQEEPAMEMIELRFQNWFNESDMHTWQIGLDQFSEVIGDISAAASKELAIEQALAGIAEQWEDLTLEIDRYKDRGHYRLK